MWWIWAATAWAAPLKAEIEWKGAKGRLTLQTEVGMHIAEDAPASLSMSQGEQTVSLGFSGAELTKGVSLPDWRGQAVSGTVSLGICDDAGTECTFRDFAVDGEWPDSKRGTFALTVSEARPPSHAFDRSAYQKDAESSVAMAFGDATTSARLVLLDFTAVWCPPCNQMSVEVLDSEDPPDILGRFVVAKIDVDDRTSWEVKSRYSVTGYPTVVATDAAGNEIGRWIGYSDREQMVAWLHEIDHRSQLPPVDLASLSGVDAAKMAWRIAKEGGDPSPWLAQAGAVDVVEARLARIQVTPEVSDALWLCEHAPDAWPDWAYAAMKVVDEPKVRAALLRTLTPPRPGEPALRASERIALLAELTEGDEKRRLSGAAASMLRATFKSDPAKDRPFYGTLAGLLFDAGELEQAVAVYRDAAAVYPDEPTYYLGAANLLVKAGQHDGALDWASRGMEHSWGDNRLRMAKALVDALVGLGRVADAQTFAEKVLLEHPAPPDTVKVRTNRYLDALRNAAWPDLKKGD